MKRDPYYDKIRMLRARIPDPEPSASELEAMPYKERRRIENAKDALERALKEQKRYLEVRAMRKKQGTEHWTKYNAAKNAGKPKKKKRRAPRTAMGWLTDMQKMFVNAVVHQQMNYTAAARYAGFKHPNVKGPHLARTPRVRRAIVVEREKYAKASGVTKKQVIDGMLEAAEMAKMKSDPTGMVQAWREVGKLCGHYEPTRHEINVSMNGQIVMQRINQMSDEELLALAEKEAGEIIEGEFEETKRLELSTEDEDSEDEDSEDEEPEYGLEEEFGDVYTWDEDGAPVELEGEELEEFLRGGTDK